MEINNLIFFKKIISLVSDIWEKILKVHKQTRINL